jgi:high-affinity Fe2+/Pb2+ permease
MGVNNILLEVKKKNLMREQKEDNETEVKETKTGSGFKDMVSILLHSQTQVHIFHLQTKSYAEHKALQGYYEGIDALVDGLIESYQGKYDVITQYNSVKNDDYKSN